MRRDRARDRASGGGLLREKEFDVIALSFPRELENSARGPEVGWPARVTETVSFSGSSLSPQGKRAPRRERLKESREICQASP